MSYMTVVIVKNSMLPVNHSWMVGRVNNNYLTLFGMPSTSIFLLTSSTFIYELCHGSLVKAHNSLK